MYAEKPVVASSRERDSRCAGKRMEVYRLAIRSAADEGRQLFRPRDPPASGQTDCRSWRPMPSPQLRAVGKSRGARGVPGGRGEDWSHATGPAGSARLAARLSDDVTDGTKRPFAADRLRNLGDLRVLGVNRVCTAFPAATSGPPHRTRPLDRPVSAHPAGRLIRTTRPTPLTARRGTRVRAGPRRSAIRRRCR
jgi:hypothetical protein